MTRKISAIIACYRDEKAIPIMYDRLTTTFKNIDVEYEIIFVNDGSPDNSEEIINSLARADSHVIAVTHARNFSSQMAFTSGMDIASGDAVILLDGDLQDPPEIIVKFYEKWIEGFEVVYGIRTKREAPLIMQACYKLFYRIFHTLSYIKIPVDSGDFSLIDRKVVDVLKSMPERDRFIRGLRAWAGFRQTGIPYTRPERMFGVTTNNLIKNFQWATKGIFSFSYAPLQAYTLISIGFFFLSLLGIVFQIVSRILNPHIPWGISSIIVIVLFIGSIQLLGIAMIGEYVGKIFEEVKARPRYVVKSIVKKSSQS